MKFDDILSKAYTTLGEGTKEPVSEPDGVVDDREMKSLETSDDPQDQKKAQEIKTSRDSLKKQAQTDADEEKKSY